MVGKLRAAVGGCLLILALSACQVLFIGQFPPSAGQATARTDMSATIGSNAASTFNLRRVTAGGKQYFLLVSPSSFDPTKAHLVVLDDGLRVLTTYTSNDLGGPPGSPFAMTDVNGDVIIGNYLFTAQPGGWVFGGSATVGLGGPSVTGMPSFPDNEINFGVNAGNLTWVEYDSSWAPTGFAPSLPMGGPSSFFLNNVLTEQDSAGMPDVFVFGGNNTTYFLLMPKEFFDSGSGNDLTTFVPTVVPTVYDAVNSYKGVIQKSNLDNNIGLAYAEVFAYDHASQALIHFSLGSPNTVNSMPLKWNQGSQIAGGATGTFCVVWDPTTRTLTRYEQWW